MGPIHLFLFITLFLTSFQLSSQCDIVPSVDGNLMLCPESEGILQTSNFESYQWFKRPFSADEAELISGATDSFLTVNYFDDVPAWFSVEVSYDSCVVMSDEYLLDGYVFLPPFVESVGDFSVGSEGEIILCNQDTAFFIFSLDTNVQWFRDFEPIIEANDKELIVTESGAYFAEGAPEECPDFIMSLGLAIDVIKKDINASQPIIDQITFEDFFITNIDQFVYWEWHCIAFEGGELTFLSTDSILVLNELWELCDLGPYFVRAIDRDGCVSWSIAHYPYINSVEKINIGIEKVFPNPITDFVNLKYSKKQDGLSYQLYSNTGSLLQTGSLSGIDQDRIDLSNFNNGYYILVLKSNHGSIGIQLVKM